MEEKSKNLFVVVFIAMFVMVYVQWMFPAPPAQAPVQTQQAAGDKPVDPTTVSPSVPSAVSPQVSLSPRTHPSIRELNESQQTVVRTGAVMFKINHLGARVQSAKLKEYKQSQKDDTPLDLISWKEGNALPLGIYADGTSDEFVLYTLDTSTLPPMDGPMFNVTAEPLTLTFTGQLATGTSVRKTLTFSPGAYRIGVDVELSQPSRDGNPVWLEWTQHVAPKDVSTVGMHTHFYALDDNNKLKSVTFNNVDAGSVDEGSAQWVAIGDYYFLQALISDSEKGFARRALENDSYIIRLSGSLTGGKFTAYAGPKDLDVLRSIGHSLDRSVDLGVFSFLAHPILALMKFFNSFLHNYGLSIILLTLLIKLAFLPLTQTSFKSMQAMQDLQPEVQALRERIEDPNVLNQELMALYKKRGVNPLGGCFPMLIQIPVFLGLYNALLNSIELRHEPFALWITDLSSPERLELLGIPIPLMILIMGASMMWQQWTQPSAMDPQQKKVMMLMPFVFTIMFILYPMPSGLVLYWLINNLISIVQQKYIRGHKGASPLAATAYASLAMFCFGFVLTLL